jgi:hypothetical protein
VAFARRRFPIAANFSGSTRPPAGTCKFIRRGMQIEDDLAKEITTHRFYYYCYEPIVQQFSLPVRPNSIQIEYSPR